jgi:hypothetical protein
VTWVKLDCGFMAHGKAQQAGPLGRELFLAGLLYSARNLTDGRITRTDLKLVAIEAGVDGRKWARRLVEVGLWDVVDDDTWQVHDYSDYQRSRADVEALHERRAAAGSKGGKVAARARRGRDAAETRYASRPDPHPATHPATDTEPPPVDNLEARGNDRNGGSNGYSKRSSNGYSKPEANRVADKRREELLPSSNHLQGYAGEAPAGGPAGGGGDDFDRVIGHLAYCDLLAAQTESTVRNPDGFLAAARQRRSEVDGPRIRSELASAGGIPYGDPGEIAERIDPRHGPLDGGHARTQRRLAEAAARDAAEKARTERIRADTAWATAELERIAETDPDRYARIAADATERGRGRAVLTRQLMLNTILTEQEHTS